MPPFLAVSLTPPSPPQPSSQHFSVLVAEGRPDGAGFETAAALAKAGVPVTVVLDSAVGYHMEVADLCVTGAEGVLENGGIVNKVGFVFFERAFCCGGGGACWKTSLSEFFCGALEVICCSL